MSNPPSSDIVLQVEDLGVRFATRSGPARAVNGVTFDVRRGETLAIVGESGSGKSVTALALMRLLREPPATVSGRILMNDRDLLRMSPADLRKVRGRDMSMIFQNPAASLNPSRPIGMQLEEGIRVHLGLGREASRRRAEELLDLVGISSPRRQLGAYPFQFSGGMQQRVMIAIALSCDPRLLIADEPTTSLDVTIQAQILDLLRTTTSRLGTSLILISHDLAVVSGVADRVAVMYAGRIVEDGNTSDLYSRPRHPYTEGLMRCIPRLDGPRQPVLPSIEGSPPNALTQTSGCPFAPRCTFVEAQCLETRPELEEKAGSQRAACWVDITTDGRHPSVQGPVSENDRADEPRPEDGSGASLLSVQALNVVFPGPRAGLLGRRSTVNAVQDVSIRLRPGETLGLVGESGSGKTSTARSIVQVQRIASGNIVFEGKDLPRIRARELHSIRPRLQMIFQDPYGSLNERRNVGQAIAEGLVVQGRHPRSFIAQRVAESLGEVGLSRTEAERFPHELSGGQLQRIGIARALISNPSLIIADEPTAALDVSIRAQILNLMRRLQAEHRLSYLFISHDLSIVRHMSDRVAVMYAGRVVETATSDELFSNPQHPYTRALLASVPTIKDRDATAQIHQMIRGTSNSETPKVGCPFHPRCPLAFDKCREKDPPLRNLGQEHSAACFLAEGHENP